MNHSKEVKTTGTVHLLSMMKNIAKNKPAPTPSKKSKKKGKGGKT